MGWVRCLLWFQSLVLFADTDDIIFCTAGNFARYYSAVTKVVSAAAAVRSAAAQSAVAMTALTAETTGGAGVTLAGTIDAAAAQIGEVVVGPETHQQNGELVLLAGTGAEMEVVAAVVHHLCNLLCLDTPCLVASRHHHLTADMPCMRPHQRTLTPRHSSSSLSTVSKILVKPVGDGAESNLGL